MDNNIFTQALDQAKNLTLFVNQKQYLLAKFKSNTDVAENGGIFNTTAELIAYVKTMIELGHESIILLDINSNPIKIEDSKQFLTKLVDCYSNAINQYHIDFEKLRRSRTLDQLENKYD
jgi:hypothetical protein